MIKKHETLLYCLHTHDTKKVPIWTWPPSPLFVAMAQHVLMSLYYHKSIKI